MTTKAPSVHCRVSHVLERLAELAEDRVLALTLEVDPVREETVGS